MSVTPAAMQMCSPRGNGSWQEAGQEGAKGQGIGGALDAEMGAGKIEMDEAGGRGTARRFGGE